MGKRLYVGNLSYDSTDDSVRAAREIYDEDLVQPRLSRLAALGRVCQAMTLS